MARFRRLRRGFTAPGARIAVLAIAIVTGVLVRGNPFSMLTALDLSRPASLAASLGASTIVAMIFVFYMRFVAEKSAFGRRLAKDLAMRSAGMTARTIFFIAASASLGEEILFRGVLVPSCGVAVAALAFGALHLKSGMAWAAVAVLFGASLGVVFAATGNLAGPLFAHFIVDALALFSASQTPVTSSPARMSGLLGAVRESKPTP